MRAVIAVNTEGYCAQDGVSCAVLRISFARPRACDAYVELPRVKFCSLVVIDLYER